MNLQDLPQPDSADEIRLTLLVEPTSVALARDPVRHTLKDWGYDKELVQAQRPP